MSIPDLPDAPVMAEAIISVIRERPGATFVEIVNRLRQLGIPVDGEIDIHLGPPNIFLWFDMTQEFADCIIELVARRLSTCIRRTISSTSSMAVSRACRSPRALQPAAIKSRTGSQLSSG